MQLTRFPAGIFAGLIAVSGAIAAPSTAPVRAEIDALLSRLESSGCQFNRNGSWYKAAEAKAHLLKKLEHLENRTTVRSTEQFIEAAASSSSASGKPYQVQCAKAGPQPSAQWLYMELAVLRALVKQAPGAK